MTAMTTNRQAKAKRGVPAGRVLWAAWLIVAVVAPVKAMAQDTPATTDTEIVAQVRFTREQFVDLTTRMLEVADLLDESEPETAQVLRQAVSQARRAFIAEDMERVASLLAQGLTSAAASNQQGVIEELQKVLEMLRAGALDLEERQERINQWRDQLRRLGRILEDQKRLEQQSRVKAHEDEINRQFEELDRQVGSLVEQQQELRDQAAALTEADLSEAAAWTAEMLEKVRELRADQETIAAVADIVGVDRLPMLAETQREAGQQATELAKELGEHGGDMVSSAAEAMAAAADHMEEPNHQEARDRAADAIADLTKAERLLEEMLAKASADTPAGRIAERQAELAQQAGEVAETAKALSEKTGRPANTDHMDAARREMERAAEKLRAQRRDAALVNQDEAIRQLKDEKYRLAQLHQRIKEQAKRDLAEQGAEQGELAGQTRETGEEMAGQDDSEPTPGAESVDRAADAMDRAAGKLGDESSGQSDSDRAGQANADQQEAIEQLERAAKELAEEIAAEQERIESEQLAKIDELLQKVLDGQRQISEATIKAYEARDAETGDYDRPEQLKLAELADGEGELSGDVARVRDMLAEEGSAVVFPIVLEQVQDDLDGAQRRLASLSAGEVTQGIQKDIELALREMIESIREELSDRRNKADAGEGAGGGGGGGGDAPLVPPVAELKMLRRLQMRIAEQTETLNAKIDALPADQASETHARLAKRQQQLQEMASALAERLEQHQQAPDDQEGGQP